MRKLFYTICILIASIGCSRESEVQTDLPTTDVVGAEVEFSLSSLTRTGDKTTWAEGDLIAIFTVNGDNYSEPHYYTLKDSQGELEVAEGSEPIYFDGNAEAYHAFYAGADKLASYEEYDALKSVNFSETDCLFSVASATFGTQVELVFDHMYAKVILEFYLPTTNDGMGSITQTMLYDAKMVFPGVETFEIFSDKSTAITFLEITETYYMAPTSSLDNSMGVVFTVTTNAMDQEPQVQTGYYTFGSSSDIIEWSAGESYTYDIDVEIHQDFS